MEIHAYSFDTLKIDRTFLNDLSSNRKSRGMITMVQVLAKTLGMKTVVEGVENADQLEFVRDIGCNYVQGYYFSKPKSFNDMTIQLQTMPNPKSWVEEEDTQGAEIILMQPSDHEGVAVSTT